MTVDMETFRAQSKLFALLDDDGRQRLLDVAEARTFADGAALMREGEAGDDFFVVTAGTVRVLIDDEGRDKQVATLSAGAFVGEIAALMGEPRSATLVAEGEVETLRFVRDATQALLAEYPKVREALVKLALKRSEDNLQEMLKTD